jgi:hypothetical protein
MESQSCPETVLVGVLGLWDVISPRPNLGSGQGLNQSCSPQRELSNAMSHFWSARRERVDSRLLVVGNQTASLTPGPSFAHNLGCKCPNGQCEAIFDIYVWRPFQWHQERLNAKCFGPCYRALNIRESRRTPIPQLFQVLGFTPTLGQSRVATLSPTRRKRSMSSLTLRIFFHTIAIAFFWILGHFANLVARPCLKLT